MTLVCSQSNYWMIKSCKGLHTRRKNESAHHRSLPHEWPLSPSLSPSAELNIGRATFSRCQTQPSELPSPFVGLNRCLTHSLSSLSNRPTKYFLRGTKMIMR
ncbi:hypothetical protein RIF29_14674 [Crotalaria pallida]|uniref:Uncharacterized protein n=1 Tax=Crotalaria pallida TaxID=3830 RepID=A0AAN9FC20_CROPI